MGACSSRESYGKGSNKFDPETQLTVEERIKVMQDRQRKSSINDRDKQIFDAEKSARKKKRDESRKELSVDEEDNFEIDPRDTQILHGYFYYSIHPPITSEHFKDVFLEVIGQIQGIFLREYVFESLAALFRYGLCDEHRQKDNLEFIVAVPPFLEREWIVIKVKKLKSKYLHTFLASIDGIKQNDSTKVFENAIGNGAKIVQKLIPVASTLLTWITISPDMLNMVTKLADADTIRHNKKMNVGFDKASTELAPAFDLLGYISQKHRLHGDNMRTLCKQFFNMYDVNEGSIRLTDYIHCFQLLQKLILGEKFDKYVASATIKGRSLENPDSLVSYLRFEKYFTVDVAAI